MNRISNISDISLINNQDVNSQSSTKIQNKLLNFLKDDPLTKFTRKLEKEVKQLSADQLSEVLNECFTYLIEQGSKVDSSQALEKLAKMIPLQKLEEAVRLKYPNHLNALQASKSLLKEAQYYLEMSEKKSSTLKTKIKGVLDLLIQCIESLITAFGIADFFKPTRDAQANTKAQRIFMLVSLFGILTAGLLPLLGAAITAPVVTGALLFLAVLSLVYPFIKPMPHRLPKAINWSKEILEYKLSVAKVNKKFLDQIAQILITCKKDHTHPMIIGKSGVGKTEIVKAFAKAIEDGVYPELKGKKVFYINSANLISTGFENGNWELKRISEVMGRHRKNIILIFDEIHVLCQKKNNIVSEQMKTFLDNAYKGFPYVIGITTQQEFYKDIYPRTAFARRFKEINIENPEDYEVEQILMGTLIQRAPATLIDPNGLKDLHQQTKIAFPDGVQPSSSLKVLSQCLKEISDISESDLEARITNIRNQIDFLNSENVMGQNLIPSNRNNFDQIKILEENLLELEKSLESYQKGILEISLLREKLASTKKEGYANILKIAKLSKVKSSDKKLLTKYLLQGYFLVPALELSIRQKAESYNIKAVINQSLVEDIIKNMKENQEKVDLAIQNGRDDLQA